MPSVKKPPRHRARHFIREWRVFRGLNQEELAAQIGMSGPNYGRIENGKVPYNQDFLESAAAVLSCEPADLLRRDPRDAVAARTIIDALEQASPEDRRRVESVVEALLKIGA